MSLVRMELNGVGFSAAESERQKKILTARMDELEAEAFRLVGHPFQMTSPEDISQVRARRDIVACGKMTTVCVNHSTVIGSISVFLSAFAHSSAFSKKHVLLSKRAHHVPDTVLSLVN